MHRCHAHLLEQGDALRVVSSFHLDVSGPSYATHVAHSLVEVACDQHGVVPSRADKALILCYHFREE